MRRILYSLIIILLTNSFNTAICQNDGINRGKYRISISATSQPPTIDGLLNEPAWQTAEAADRFRRVLPTDTGYAIAQTEVKAIYTESTLYFGIVCYDPVPGKRPVESFRRDFAFTRNDNFIVFIDTYNDFTNGFAFGVSPAGAQWDGQQANGGTVNLDWDIKWRSEVRNYDDRWVAEFAIPFRSLRYNEGTAEWGINFSRNDLKTNEKSSWAPMPRQFATATLAFTGSLVWDKPLPASGPRFSLIPYITGRILQDKTDFGSIKKEAEAGIDAKVILSTSLNLDLTVNPDYSQVEVDRQVTNLDRFELFFPEKRQFYLENSDLFANLGTDNLRPFFSRRIGLNNPVTAGARLSGRLGKNWRLGLMDIQTSENDIYRAGNYAVAALQRKVFSHSNITAFMVSKQLTGNDNDTSTYENLFNRVAGLEYNLATADNRWTGKAFYHHSFYPGSDRAGSAAAALISYSTQYLKLSLNQSYAGSGYISETGYIRRRGYYEVAPSFQYKFFPAESRIANHGPGIRSDIFFNKSMEMTDRETQIFYQVEWLNKSLFQADARETYIRLQFPFDPTNSLGDSLDANSGFRWVETGFTFTSDIRKPLNFLLGSRYGGFFNGTKFTATGELYYRVQPYGSLAILASYNDISLPDPYNSAEFVLVGPRVDLTFTSKLFMTGFVQYNNQINNLNLNFRFQWRFAPVSDLFIVYTENSVPRNFTVKNRGLVFKVSYWFN